MSPSSETFLKLTGEGWKAGLEAVSSPFSQLGRSWAEDSAPSPLFFARGTILPLGEAEDIWKRTFLRDLKGRPHSRSLPAGTCRGRSRLEVSQLRLSDSEEATPGECVLSKPRGLSEVSRRLLVSGSNPPSRDGLSSFRFREYVKVCAIVDNGACLVGLSSGPISPNEPFSVYDVAGTRKSASIESNIH